MSHWSSPPPGGLCQVIRCRGACPIYRGSRPHQFSGSECFQTMSSHLWQLWARFARLRGAMVVCSPLAALPLHCRFFRHFVDWARQRDSLRVLHLAESDAIFARSNAIGQEATQFASKRTPAYNSTPREPQSSTSLGSKVRRMRRMRFLQRTRLRESASPLGGVSQNEHGEGRYISHY